MNAKGEFKETARISELGEEEKKDSAEIKGATESASDNGSSGGGGDDDGSSRDEYELQPLSDEIVARLGHEKKDVYENDQELQRALEKAGIGDARIILVDGKPYELVPSTEHNSFTANFAIDFNIFVNGPWGRWGACNESAKIRLSDGFSRDPDLSYWGYPRCNEKCTGPRDPDSIPDVVIQFSWKNTFAYEKSAMDDIMNQGLEKRGGPLSTTCPRVGYLIKVRFSRRRSLAAFPGRTTQDMVGLDIYRLVHGTTIDDARNATNRGAELLRYTEGGEDILIVIKPEDLGITGWFAAWRLGSYVLKASEMFHEVNEMHKALQAEGLA
jgi:hypothetical protein